MRLDWFKFYPSDFLNSPVVMMMTPAARGCYITLLGRCWLNAKNGGGIPSKTDYILSVCNCSAKEWDSVKDTVLSRFEEKNGQLFNLRLMEEIVEVQDLSDTKRENAQSGWETRRLASALHPQNGCTNSASYIDREEKREELETDKNESKGFKTIAIRYRSLIGKPHSKAKYFKDQYSRLAAEYGEQAILNEFETWAADNQWRADKLGNTGLRWFFNDLPAAIEETQEFHKIENQQTEQAAAVLTQIEQSREMTDAAKARLAEVEEDKKQIESLRDEPIAF